MSEISVHNSQRLNRRIVLSDNKLLEAIGFMESLPDSDKVDIGGKLYAQVTTRVVAFRKAYGDQGRITTTIHVSNENRVQIEARVYVRDGNTWHLIANDWAEEFRSDGFINKKSATENCATSAIGRALAACGLGGGEYASGDEVDYAKTDKAEIGSGKAKAEKKEPAAKKTEEVKPKPKEVKAEEPKAVEETKKIDPSEWPTKLRAQLNALKDMHTHDQMVFHVKKYAEEWKKTYGGTPAYDSFVSEITALLKAQQELENKESF